MNITELRLATAPFKVKFKGKKKISVVTGFSQNDPLGVGGGMLPDMPCAFFEKGGWVLVDDLIKHYDMVPNVELRGE